MRTWGGTEGPPLQFSAHAGEVPRHPTRNRRSRETPRAIIAVNKFSSSKLVAAGVPARPGIDGAGPATPPAAIAPTSHASSGGWKRLSSDRADCGTGLRRSLRMRHRHCEPGAGAGIGQACEHEQRDGAEEVPGERDERGVQAGRHGALR